MAPTHTPAIIRQRILHALAPHLVVPVVPSEGVRYGATLEYQKTLSIIALDQLLAQLLLNITTSFDADNLLPIYFQVDTEENESVVKQHVVFHAIDVHE